MLDVNSETGRTVGRRGVLAVHPTDPSRIAAATSDGVVLSHDGGASWAALPST